MGDLNAVDIAQLVYEHILRHSGGLRAEAHLRYKKPLKSSLALSDGVYVDDRLVVGWCARSKLNQDGPDSDLIKQARKSYELAGLTVATEKAFLKQRDFAAWGAEVLGEAGIVAAPRSKRMQICIWLLHTARLKHITIEYS